MEETGAAARDSVYLQYQLQAEDHSDATRAVVVRVRSVQVMLAGATLLLLLSAAIWLLGGEPPWVPLVLLLVIAGGTLWWAPYSAWRKAHGNPRYTSHVVCQADERSIAVRSPYQQVRLDWPSFQRWFETGRLFVLIQTANPFTYLFVPKRAFDSPEQQARFRALLAASVHKRKP